MKSDKITEALETAADQLGVKVRYENLPPGGMLNGGGLCRVRGVWNLIIDRKTTPSERIQILTDTLSRFDTESVKLPPRIRENLQSRRKSTAQPTAP